MFKVLFGIAVVGSIVSVGKAAYDSIKKDREYQQQLQQMQQQVIEKVAQIKEKEQQLASRDSEIEILDYEHKQQLFAKKCKLVLLESEFIGISSMASQLCDCVDALNQEKEEYSKASNEELVRQLEEAEKWDRRKQFKREQILELTDPTYDFWPLETLKYLDSLKN